MLQGSCTCLSGFPFSGMVPHHDEQASENGNPERHVQLPCNMLPPYLCLLIAVTFSTPTPDSATYEQRSGPLNDDALMAGVQSKSGTHDPDVVVRYIVCPEPITVRHGRF